ncbi:MAG: TlpA family protein disulfide reductase [Anaerolineae bacterium]|nr:TlpA family protein disulfide reductase [Anaerolineae bacterium]
MAYRRQWWALAVVIVLTLSPGPVGHAEEATPTPPADDALRALAAAVLEDNQNNGNFTQWRGGNLGTFDDAMPRVSYGQKMAGFALPDASGATIILDRIDGPKLVNFWATWCAPCVEEFPLLSEVARAADAPFGVVFVNVWDDPRAFAEFADAHPDLALVRDVRDAVNTDLGVFAIPTSLLIDSDGVVRAIHVGNITPPVMDLLKAVAASLD